MPRDDLGRLSPRRLSGAEAFRGGEGVPDFHVLDFWRWSSSDLVSNATRGVLAEYIVGKALGCRLEVRDEWAPYDPETPEGYGFEVKSALTSKAGGSRGSRRSRSRAGRRATGIPRPASRKMSRAATPMHTCSPCSRIATRRRLTRSTFPSGSSTRCRRRGSTPARAASTRPRCRRCAGSSRRFRSRRCATASTPRSSGI